MKISALRVDNGAIEQQANYFKNKLESLNKRFLHRNRSSTSMQQPKPEQSDKNAYDSLLIDNINKTHTTV